MAIWRQHSLLAFFHLCLVSRLFSAPSLLEIKFYRNLFSLSTLCWSTFLIQVLGRLKPLLRNPDTWYDEQSVAEPVKGSSLKVISSETLAVYHRHLVNG